MSIPGIGISEGDLRCNFANDDDEESGYVHGPIRALMAAILFDAVQSYMNFIDYDAPEHHKRYREAVNWIENESEDYIFTFNSICRGLGLDPEFLRSGLLSAKEDGSYRWGYARRNF